ncbi:hypothetical protein LCGC14_2934830, partial [marine sediment metagenome]
MPKQTFQLIIRMVAKSALLTLPCQTMLHDALNDRFGGL